MTENTGFEAFALYNALKTHFTSSSYDFFKYNGKTNVTKDSFMKNKAKYQFYKLSRKYSLEQLRNFFLANFIYGDSTWVGEMLGPEGDKAYSKWQKTNQSLTYVFENDIIRLVGNDAPEQMLVVNDGQHPKLLREVMSGTIAIETMVILNDIMHFFPMWNRKISDDIIWPNWRLKCEKYAPFVTYDKVKFKNILKEIVIEHA
jgi:T4 gene Gp59 loader of gp41 DNA helicase/T4 gene Gp59 loader of gp41 DNA helicase C-term